MAEYYKSIYTGKQIDTAIGRITSGELDEAFDGANASAASAEQSATAAKESETNAKGSADSSAEQAVKAESWAVGGTGTREGEDVNNAKYWANYSRVASGGSGATFYPSVSADGVISWTNDGNLENPEPVSIKGPKGDSSPYDLAVEEGYTGTEAEFYAALVSLKDAPFLPLSGGTMSGDLKLSNQADLVGDDDSPAGSAYMSVRQGTVMFGVYPPGSVSREDVPVNGVADPQVDNGAANKRYVDSEIKSVSEKTGVPVGCILLWSGSTSNIPSGWHLCDGQEGTPDLRDRFVVGAGNTYSVGKTGGEVSHTLTTAELPSHSHGSGSLAASSAGSHTHSYSEASESTDRYGVGGVGDRDVVTSLFSSSSTTGSGGSHSHSVSGSTGSTGSGAAHNNLPPYYALCYIMRVS